MLRTLDHIILVVRDLPESTDTYTSLLGRQPGWRGEHPETSTRNTLFRLDNTYVELLAPAGPGVVAEILRSRLDAQGEGLFALAFGTENATRCSGTLRERGLSAAEPSDGRGTDSATGVERCWRNVMLPVTETRGVLLFAIEHLSPPESLPRSEPVADEKTVVAGLDHVVITTQDPDAIRQLYGEKLGIRLALERTFHERGVTLQFFRIGGITLEFASRLEPKAGEETPDHLWGLAYRVPDVSAARERLAQAGFDVSEVRSGHKEGTRVCTVRREALGVGTLLIGPA